MGRTLSHISGIVTKNSASPPPFNTTFCSHNQKHLGTEGPGVGNPRDDWHLWPNTQFHRVQSSLPSLSWSTASKRKNNILCIFQQNSQFLQQKRSVFEKVQPPHEIWILIKFALNPTIEFWRFSDDPLVSPFSLLCPVPCWTWIRCPPQGPQHPQLPPRLGEVSLGPYCCHSVTKGTVFSEASLCLFLQISLDRVSAAPLLISPAVSSVDFSLESHVPVNNLAALVQSS